MIFKTDFEKNYDHVEGDFLNHVLERKGFGAKWRSWICGNLFTTKFVMLL